MHGKRHLSSLQSTASKYLVSRLQIKKKSIIKPKMEAKLAGSSQTPFYDDFEPFCNWRREEGRDTLVVHLPEFKKEQMKIQISSVRVLKISGERALNASKRSRFYKEVKVSNECNVNDIHAKFVNGLLHVVMPKKISVAAPAQNPPPIQPLQTDQNPNPNGRTSPDDKITEMPTANKESSLPSENAAVAAAAAAAAAAIGKTATNSEFQQESSVPRWRSHAKKAIKVGLALALVSAIGAYILYEYNSSHVGDLDAFDP